MTVTSTDKGEHAKTAGFFINAGTHSGWFTTPDGDVYDIRKFEPPAGKEGVAGSYWAGFATARDRDVAANDAALQSRFRKTGERPSALFAPAARDIPLYIVLRRRPGKGYSDIGSFWNAKARTTIFARHERSARPSLRRQLARVEAAWRACGAQVADGIVQLTCSQCFAPGHRVGRIHFKQAAGTQAS
jgi:hypothetical protein